MPFLYIPYIPTGEGGNGDSVREITGYRKLLHYADMLYKKSGTHEIHGKILQVLFLSEMPVIPPHSGRIGEERG